MRCQALRRVPFVPATVLTTYVRNHGFGTIGLGLQGGGECVVCVHDHVAARIGKSHSYSIVHDLTSMVLAASNGVESGQAGSRQKLVSSP